MEDRDRIAAELQDKVIQQVFAAGMSLHSTAMLATQSEVRRRILAAADSMDQVLRLTRDAVFGLEHQRQGRGLRAEIVDLCEDLSQKLASPARWTARSQRRSVRYKPHHPGSIRRDAIHLVRSPRDAR